MRPLLIAVTALSTALAPAGSGWSIQLTPNPSQHENLLYGVSCPSAAACTAVGGGFSAKQQVPRNIALTWNGSRWSAASVPDPAGAAYSILKDVSCASASTCIAVGDDSSGTVGVARSGTRWSVLSTVNPPTAESSQLHSVSCRSATACTAVGWYEQIVGWIDQVFPFHVSARLNARRAEPTICSYQPTAVHAVAERHETLSSWLLSAVGGLTVDRTDHRVPLRATPTVPLLSSPTAMHVLAEAHDTSLRML